MKLNKIILTSDESIRDSLINRYGLVKNDSENIFEIFEWTREYYKDEEVLILAYFTNIDTSFNYISENYDIDKVILLWRSEPLHNNDLQIWDIMIPNTFIDSSNKPMFLEYSIWENYDMKKFW